MDHKAGDRVEYVVTFLEMEGRPAYPRPHMPPGLPSALLAADTPPVWWFFALYDTVGAEYEWTDQRVLPPGQVEAFLAHDDVTLFTLMRGGWPNGFFVLDGRSQGLVELCYFGLAPEAIGQGLGTFLAQTAVHMAWDRPGVARVAVNTNSLDHPRALPLYQKAGFSPVRRETRSRVLTRDRNLIGD